MKKDFEIEFTPIILIPKINTEEIINTEINLELCLHKINHIDNNYEEYLDCEISSLTLELISIEDIEP